MGTAIPTSPVSRIRAIREACGFSLDEVAEMAGLPRARLSKIEHGTIEPTNADLFRVAVVLATAARVMVGDGPPEHHGKSSLLVQHDMFGSNGGRRRIPPAP